MSFTNDQKIQIADKLRKAVTLDQLSQVLNDVQDINNSNPWLIHTRKPISAKRLKYLLYGKKGKNYISFEIAKKSGGTRKILAPNANLKNVQYLIKQCLECLYTPQLQAHGFVTGRSVVTNAARHTNKKYVYNIDLKDFFPSIVFGRVKATLCKVKQIGLNPEVSHFIANLCCVDGKLPQGAPTSPILSNFVSIRLDKKLYFKSKEENFTYTRYADDITISSNKNIFTDLFKKGIRSLILEEGFELNTKKERLQAYQVRPDGVWIRERQEVTGIVVNKGTNVSSKYIKNLRATLYNWEKYGYDIANLLHHKYYTRSKGITRYNGHIPCLENVINGRLEYLGMVRGKGDPKYQLLKVTYDTLCVKEKSTPAYFLQILETWEKEGIEKAMNLFYDRRNLSNEAKEV